MKSSYLFNLINLFLMFFISVSTVESKELEFELKKIDENLVMINIVPTDGIIPEYVETEINDNEYPYHKVIKGEYLSKISKTYNKKTSKLVEINEIRNPDLIYPEQKVYLEKKKPVDMNLIPEYYTVKKGENLISIAYSYDLDWKKIKKINNLNAITDIYPGMRIKLK